MITLACRVGFDGRSVHLSRIGRVVIVCRRPIKSDVVFLRIMLIYNNRYSPSVDRILKPIIRLTTLRAHTFTAVELGVHWDESYFQQTTMKTIVYTLVLICVVSLCHFAPILLGICRKLCRCTLCPRIGHRNPTGYAPSVRPPTPLFIRTALI